MPLKTILLYFHLNDNLKQIDLIHLVYSVVNNRVREISDWKSFEDKGIHNSLDVWDPKSSTSNQFLTNSC